MIVYQKMTERDSLANIEKFSGSTIKRISKEDGGLCIISPEGNALHLIDNNSSYSRYILSGVDFTRYTGAIFTGVGLRQGKKRRWKDGTLERTSESKLMSIFTSAGDFTVVCHNEYATEDQEECRGINMCAEFMEDVY